MPIGKGKDQKNLALTDLALRMLSKMADAEGLSESAMVELLIRAEARRRDLM